MKVSCEKKSAFVPVSTDQVTIESSFISDIGSACDLINDLLKNPLFIAYRLLCRIAAEKAIIVLCADRFRRYTGDRLPDAEENIIRYILPIRPDRADRRKAVPKRAVFFLYRVT